MPLRGMPRARAAAPNEKGRCAVAALLHRRAAFLGAADKMARRLEEGALAAAACQGSAAPPARATRARARTFYSCVIMRAESRAAQQGWSMVARERQRRAPFVSVRRLLQCTVDGRCGAAEAGVGA